jgi:hypothetical protein
MTSPYTTNTPMDPPQQEITNHTPSMATGSITVGNNDLDTSRISDAESRFSVIDPTTNYAHGCPLSSASSTTTNYSPSTAGLNTKREPGCTYQTPANSV